jgi:glycosyltransferase involved in cell wall biosynthesis
MESGHNVKVVRVSTKFPSLYNMLARPFTSLISAKTGSNIDVNNKKGIYTYRYENVEVLNISIKKYYPHQVPESPITKGIADKIVDHMNTIEFKPSVIIGHWILPTLGILHFLKQHTKCRTCIVSHDSSVNSIFAFKEYKEYMKSIDVWGFRAKPFLDSFEKSFGTSYRTFICYSGIPEEFLTEGQRIFDHGIHKFVFLGSLFKLKKVDLLIQSIHQLGKRDTELYIIGDGTEKKGLIRLTNQLRLNDQVHFLGRLPRKDAQELMKKFDCFVMISKEAFGLVYLEAMAKGLITIALKGSGMDGVIQHARNGFLCEDQTVKSLLKTIREIEELTADQLAEISNQAKLTAHSLTDRKASEYYLESIMS